MPTNTLLLRLSGSFFAIGLLAACASPPTIIDNPKDGDTISLTVGQPLTVKLSDMAGPKIDWAMSTQLPAALTVQGHRVIPADGGAMPLDIYEFVGGTPGEQKLTFAYRHPDEAPTPDNTITLTVTVKS